MAREWTKEQQNAISGRGGTILVSAAAGSGKTAVLVERVIQKLTDRAHPVDADRLLIATFSNAAAGEMKERIDAALGELLAARPGDAWLHRQRMLLQKAHISTIHSFCLELVREHFDVLGLDAKFAIGDETQLSDLSSAAMEELLENAYQKAEPGFKALCEFLCVRNDKPLSQLVGEVYEFLRSHPFPEDWMEQSLLAFRAKDLSQTDWGGLLWAYVEEALKQAGELTQKALDAMEGDEAMKAAYGPVFLDDLNGILKLQELCGKKDWDGLYNGVHSFSFSRMGQLRKYEDAEKKEWVSGLRKEVKKLLSDLASRQVCATEEAFCQDMQTLYPIVEALFQLVREYGAVLDQKKRDARIVDFSDLEHYALSLLAVRRGDTVEKTPLAKELSGQFEEILLDEYQDVNQIQDTIFTLLSREETNLFMVGDVKQSIYRFRQARPELFLRRQDRYTPYDREHFPAKVLLTKNFRSRPEVAKGVNFVFSQLMSREMGEVEYGEQEALFAAGKFIPLPQRETELHIVETGKEGEENPEAAHVAELIASMLAKGYPVQEGETFRPCQCRDFCILLRTSKKAEEYAKALSSLGLSAWSDTTTGYFDSREISVMLNLLRIIDNPLQDIPLLSVMLSPMYGFTPDEAAAIRTCSKNTSLYAAVLAKAKQGDARVQAFLHSLAEMRQWAAVLSAGQLIRKIYDSTDFMAVVGAMPSGEQKQANLRLLLEYASRYETIGNSGLSGFLRFVDRTAQNGEDFSSANTISEQADVVRIMTIHRSKGLEFPICIVADCAKAFNKEDLNASALKHPELGFSIKVRDPERLKAYTTLRHEAIRLQLEAETLSEEMRILYVAATRAKEKLVFVTSCPNLSTKLAVLSLRTGEGDKLPPFGVRKASSYGDWLLMAALRHPAGEKLRKLAGQEQRVIPAESGLVTILSPEKGETPEQAGALEFHCKASAEDLKELAEKIEYRYPYRETSGIAAKLAVTQIVHSSEKAGARLDERPAFSFGAKLSPAQRGTIIHQFIQFADYQAAREDLLTEMERMLTQGFLSEQETAVLPIGHLSAFFNSPLMSRILSADQIYREYRFFDEIPAGEVYPDLSPEAAGERIFIQGIADCVIVEENKAVIIDYKTDRVATMEELAEKYEKQLIFYKSAVGKALGMPVKECVLYSVPLEQSLSLPDTDR